jgi:intracellular septation protein A
LVTLALLGLAFGGRVAAQLFQYWYDVDWLPAFDSWQSGALPYGVLVAAQLMIMAVQVGVVVALYRGALLLTRRGIHIVAALGAVYAVAMIFRLGAGLTLWADNSWFEAWLPTVFHLVLAAFLLVVAHHHLVTRRPPVVDHRR